jgi:prefoldin beta subunit
MEARSSLSQPEISPALREQLARFEQLQQNLQSVLIQKQQVEAELSEAEKALEELRKAPDSDEIFKYAGSLMIKVSKEDIMKELEEKKELSNTRVLVLGKQETRLRESLKELQAKLDEAMKGRSQAES